MKNRITALFRDKPQELLSIYFTAGFPALNDTCTILAELEKNGVDMVEIGVPFSDPLADGPVIQQSSQHALQNGMSMEMLFRQLSGIRDKVKIPVVLMGYLNPVYQYGIERFCKHCREVGVDGVILPDLPLEEYKSHFEKHFVHAGLSMIFLVTPQTSDERIKIIDQAAEGFIYVVSSSSTTGNQLGAEEKVLSYFKRIKNLSLKNPIMIGFGITNKEDFQSVCKYASGGIIGTQFIKEIQASKNGLAETIAAFVKKFKN